MEKNIEAILAQLTESTKSAHKRLDKLEGITDTIYSLASDTKLIAQSVSNQQKAIDKINANLDDLNNKPGKWVDLVKSTLISAIFGGIGATIIALLLKK